MFWILVVDVAHELETVKDYSIVYRIDGKYGYHKNRIAFFVTVFSVITIKNGHRSVFVLVV
jgi:hypothetical protein